MVGYADAPVAGRFAKGRSGNPGGRPSINKDAKALAKANCHKAMAKLIELLDDADSRVVIAAAKEILDRGLGKAPAAPEDQDAIKAGGIQINIVRFNDNSAEPARTIEHASVADMGGDDRPLRVSDSDGLPVVRIARDLGGA